MTFVRTSIAYIRRDTLYGSVCQPVGLKISKIIINSATQHSPTQKLSCILSTSLPLMLCNNRISADRTKIEGLNRRFGGTRRPHIHPS
jgi:hypothetical protein